MLDHIPPARLPSTWSGKYARSATSRSFWPITPLLKHGRDDDMQGGKCDLRTRIAGLSNSSMTSSFQEMNVKLLEQPAQTITHYFYTRPQFAVGSTYASMSAPEMPTAAGRPRPYECKVRQPIFPVDPSSGDRVLTVASWRNSALRLQESDLRPLLGGVGQMPGIAGQEYRGAVMVVGQGAEIAVDEALQCERTVGLDPARGR